MSLWQSLRAKFRRKPRLVRTKAGQIEAAIMHEIAAHPVGASYPLGAVRGVTVALVRSFHPEFKPASVAAVFRRLERAGKLERIGDLYRKPEPKAVELRERAA